MKRLEKNFFLLLPVILVFHYLISPLFYRPIIHKVPSIASLRQIMTSSADILFLTDSTNNYPVMYDLEKTTINGYLQQNIPNNLSLKVLTGAGFNSLIFSDICQYIVQHGYRPKIVIIPINIRAFGAGWDRAPVYQFGIERFYLRQPYLLPFYKILSRLEYDFNHISMKEFLQTPVFDRGQNLGPLQDFEIREPWQTYYHSNQKNIVRTGYMVAIPASHRQITALLTIKKTLNRNNIALITYLTPIDHQVCAEYYGQEFYKRLGENIRTIISVLDKAGIDCIDLSLDLGSESFGWRTQFYLNEHMNCRGRRYIGEKLAQSVRQIISR